jgi:spermidine synthase
VTKQTFQSLIAILLLLSSAAACIFFIAGFDYLLFILGNTVTDRVIIASVMFIGFAAGALLFGIRADRVHDPVRFYSILCLALSFYLFFFPGFSGITEKMFIESVLLLNIGFASPILFVIRSAVAIALFFIPAALTGGLLPALVKGLTVRSEESGRMISVLFFLAGFGVLTGVVMTGFFLIRLIGLETAMKSAALLTGAVGVSALILSFQHYSIPHNSSAFQSVATTESFSVKEIFIARIVLGLSGFIVMMFYSGWLRMLTPLFGSSVYSQTAVLSAFVTGMAAGFWLTSKWLERVTSRFSFLASVLFGIVFSTLLLFQWYSAIPSLFFKVCSFIARLDETFPIFLFIQYTVSLIVLFLPALFLGMIIPLASGIVSGNAVLLGKRAGISLSAVFAGLCIGLSAAVLFFIPRYGVQRTLEAAVAAAVIAGVIVLAADTRRTMANKVTLLFFTAVLSVAYSLYTGNWNKQLLYSRLYQGEESKASELTERTLAEKYYADGEAGTIAVVEDTSAGSHQMFLVVDGKISASSVSSLPAQILLAQLPMLFHESPDSVLVIGISTGVTPGSVLTHEASVVDCIEPNRKMIEASTYFDDINGLPQNDPRFTIYSEDARIYVTLTRKQYDVIINTSHFSSSQFYQSCKEKMHRSGLMVQLLNLNQYDDESLKLALRTFRKEFPWTTLWNPSINEAILLGARYPMLMSLEGLRKHCAYEKVNRDLARINLNHVPSLLSMQSFSSGQVKEYADYGEITTKDTPLLEYAVPRASFTRKVSAEFRRNDERSTITGGELLLKSYVRRFPLSTEDMYRIAEVHSDNQRGNTSIARSLLTELNKHFPRDQHLLAQLASLQGEAKSSEEHEEYLAQLAALHPNDPVLLSRYAQSIFSSKRAVASFLLPATFTDCEQLMMKAIILARDTTETFRMQFGDMLFEIQQFGRAIEQYQRALEIRQQIGYIGDVSLAGILIKLSRAYYFNGHLPKALEYAAHASILNPASEEIKNYLYKIAMRQLEE